MESFIVCYHPGMSDSFLDFIPSQEREKIRRRMRSPEEYERLREKVKGPEDLEREMSKNSEYAEFSFGLEAEKGMKESVKQSIAEQIADAGVQSVVEGKLDKQTKAALEAGKFDVIADSSQEASPKLRIKPSSGNDKGGSIDAPSGKVSEALPLKPSFQDKLVSSFQIKKR